AGGSAAPRFDAEDRANSSAAHAVGQLLLERDGQPERGADVSRSARRALSARARALPLALARSLATLLAHGRALRAALPRARSRSERRAPASARVGLPAARGRHQPRRNPLSSGVARASLFDAGIIGVAVTYGLLLTIATLAGVFGIPLMILVY